MILAGDIGGTKTRLALFDLLGSRLHCLAEEKYASRGCSSLLEVVGAFVGKHRPRVEAACFGVAGPVRHGRAQATNLPAIRESGALG